MKQLFKRWISFLLVLVMVGSLLPLQAFAEAVEEETVIEESLIEESPLPPEEEDPAVTQVQQLIDALPAEVTTQEEATALESLLAEVDTAMAALTEDQLAQLDLTAYDAASAALAAFTPADPDPIVEEEPIPEEEPIQEEQTVQENSDSTTQEESLQQSSLSLPTSKSSTSLSGIIIEGTTVTIVRNPATFTSDEVQALITRLVEDTSAYSDIYIDVPKVDAGYEKFWPIDGQSVYTFTENYYVLHLGGSDGLPTDMSFTVTMLETPINGMSIDGNQVTITKSPATFTDSEIQTLITRLVPDAPDNAIINIPGTPGAYAPFWPVSGQGNYTFTDGEYYLVYDGEGGIPIEYPFTVTLTENSIGASWNPERTILSLHAKNSEAPMLSLDEMRIMFEDAFLPYTTKDLKGNESTYIHMRLSSYIASADGNNSKTSNIWYNYYTYKSDDLFGPMYDRRKVHQITNPHGQVYEGSYSYLIDWTRGSTDYPGQPHTTYVELYDILTVTTNLDGKTTTTKQNIDRGTKASVTIEAKEGYECVITGHDEITKPGTYNLGELTGDVNITVTYNPIVKVVYNTTSGNDYAYLIGDSITGEKVTEATVSHGETLTLKVITKTTNVGQGYVKSVTTNNGTTFNDDGSFEVIGPTTITVEFIRLLIPASSQVVIPVSGYTGQYGNDYHYRVEGLCQKVLENAFDKHSNGWDIEEFTLIFNVYVDGGEDGEILVPLSAAKYDPLLDSHLPVNPDSTGTDTVKFIVKSKSGFGASTTVNAKLVESRTGKFTIKNPHMLPYKYGFDALPSNETIYNTSISAPAYDSYAISTHLAPDGIEYLARPAEKVTIDFGTLNILGKEIELGSQIFSVANTWVPIQNQDFTVPTRDDLVVEALKSLGIDENATSDTISSVQDQITANTQVLVDAIAEQMTYYGAHYFGDGTSEETLHVVYDTEDTYINDYTVPITLEDPREATNIIANNIQKDYGVTFTEEDLKEALGAKLRNDPGIFIDGKLTYKIPDSLIGKPSAGKYTVTISFAGNDTYKACSYEATVTIKKLKCEIHYPDAIKLVKYGDDYDYALVKVPKDVPAIELLLGVNVGEVMEDGEIKGVKPTLGVVIPTVRVHIFGDYYLDLNVPEGTYSLTDLTKKLEDMNVPGFGSLIDKLDGVLNTMTGATGIQDIEVIVSHTAQHPEHVGLYLTGAMTVSSNYETAYALGSIFIYPEAALETLTWVHEGPIFTEKELEAYIGSAEYLDTAKPPYLGAVTKNGKTDIDKEIKYITFSDTGAWYTLGYDLSNYNFTTMKDVKQPGKYRQLAYNISTLGNLGDKMEFVMPALRTFRIITSKATIKITDPRDQNFKHTYDGTEHPVNAQAYYSDGSKAEGGKYTITYNGSKTAPTLPGTYKVEAKYHDDPRVDPATAEKTLTISQAKLTLEMTKAEKYYGQDDSAIVYEYKPVTGLIKGHTVAENGITIQRNQEGEDAKENHYALKAIIKVVDQSGNDVSHCYTTELTGVKLTIKPAEVTITPKDFTKSVDAEDPEFTYDYEITQGLDTKTDEEKAELIKALEITIAKAEEPRNTDSETGVEEYDLEVTIGKKNPNLKITLNKGTLKEIPAKYICWNMDTAKYYETVSAGLDEALSGQTVQMLKNATAAENQKNERYVEVGAGVTFDLNGLDVEARNVISYGVILDTAAVPGGILIDIDTDKAWTKLQPENGGYLPVYDTTYTYENGTKSGRYQFFKYNLNNYNYVPGENSVKFRFRIEFDNPLAYSVLAATGNSGITLYCDMDWTGNSGFDIKYYIPDSIVTEYAQNRVEGLNVLVYLNTYGLNKLVEHAVIHEELYVATLAGVTSGSRVLSYTKPN